MRMIVGLREVLGTARSLPLSWHGSEDAWSRASGSDLLPLLCVGRRVRGGLPEPRIEAPETRGQLGVDRDAGGSG